MRLEAYPEWREVPGYPDRRTLVIPYVWAAESNAERYGANPPWPPEPACYHLRLATDGDGGKRMITDDGNITWTIDNDPPGYVLAVHNHCMIGRYTVTIRPPESQRDFEHDVSEAAYVRAIAVPHGVLTTRADLEADDRPERSLAPRAGPMPAAPVPYGLKDMNARCR